MDRAKKKIRRVLLYGLLRGTARQLRAERDLDFQRGRAYRREVRPNVRHPVPEAVPDGVGLAVHRGRHALVRRVDIVLHFQHLCLAARLSRRVNQHRLDCVLAQP